MEGFLSKQGEKGLVVNLWRKRWFQLDTTALRIYYYKTKSKEELLGSINLAEASDVISTEPKDAFSFTISTRDRAWNLAAASEIDKQVWMNVIQRCISKPAAVARPTSIQPESAPAAVSAPVKSSEYLGIFEFEGEEGEARMPAGSVPEETPGPLVEPMRFEDDDDDYDGADYHPPAPPNPTPMQDRPSFLVGSLPVNVPRMAQTWQANPTWTMAHEADDDAQAAFEKPHEMAAKTYKETFLETGISDFNRPRSHSKRLQANI